LGGYLFFPGEHMKISEYLKPEDVISELAAVTKIEVIEELTAVLAGHHEGIDRKQLLEKILEREKLGSTGIGGGIAIPHAKLKAVENIMVVFGRSGRGVNFNALDGKPVHIFFLLVARDENFGAHLKLLARISRILKNPSFRKRLLEAGDAESIYQIIREQDERF
jgi:PTS system nitrogen regulatory IIA component